MVPLENLIAFAIASLLLVAIPGPSVLFVVGRSIALGRRGGLLSVLGNAIGMIPLVAAVALGLGAVISSSAVMFMIIKFAGAAYLVYLGVQAIRHRRDATGPAEVAPKSGFRLLREGVVVGSTNPKTIAFFVAVLPQFVVPERGTVGLQLGVLGLIFIVVALLGDSIWALAAGAARDWFASSPQRISRLGAAGGVMMIGLGGVLALTSKS